MLLVTYPCIAPVWRCPATFGLWNCQLFCKKKGFVVLMIAYIWYKKFEFRLGWISFQMNSWKLNYHNKSNHELSWPLAGIDKWIPSTFMNFHETLRKVKILIWTCGISWSFMALQGSTFHQKFSEVKNHETFANCYQISRIFMKNGPN